LFKKGVILTSTQLIIGTSNQPATILAWAIYIGFFACSIFVVWRLLITSGKQEDQSGGQPKECGDD
tara:strand:- start:570 stop:767 length:198 start_codon:yes stop_codon:yes gene_type:complete